eukprot:COSAG06_NODE_1306_length_9917_cov_12.542167_5_plen_55_part_00
MTETYTVVYLVQLNSYAINRLPARVASQMPDLPANSVTDSRLSQSQMCCRELRV